MLSNSYRGYIWRGDIVRHVLLSPSNAVSPEGRDRVLPGGVRRRRPPGGAGVGEAQTYMLLDSFGHGVVVGKDLRHVSDKSCLTWLPAGKCLINVHP